MRAEPGRFSEKAYSVMRVMVGALFACHGAQKLFGAFGGQVAGKPLMIVGGIIEFGGGLLVALGLLTRPAAFLASGMMAVAYFMAHAPERVLADHEPRRNGGSVLLRLPLYFGPRRRRVQPRSDDRPRQGRSRLALIPRFLQERIERRFGLGVQGRRRAVEGLHGCGPRDRRGAASGRRSRRRTRGRAPASPSPRPAAVRARRRACARSAPRDSTASATTSRRSPWRFFSSPSQRERAAAGRAPGRPELDEHDLPGEVRARQSLRPSRSVIATAGSAATAASSAGGLRRARLLLSSREDELDHAREVGAEALVARPRSSRGA